MNISYNWLKQYINVDVAPEELAAALTSIGLEVGAVERVQTIKGGLEGLVVGQVVECVKHENSDHLHVTTVNIGLGEPLQVVCGAPNVAAGQKVVVATVGTVLYSGEESFTIKRSKIRGVESCGMLCAEDEIGVGSGHDGIMVLPPDTPVGLPAKRYFNIEDDVLLEVDITPNRIDAASHYGVARDLAAYFALKNPTIKLRRPSIEAFAVQNQERTIAVEVASPTACQRYSALTITGIKVQESPEWLQNRLRTVGMRPINNVVDATNYVMLEMGQPLHAFDADKIKGGKVVVKNGFHETKFTTLDGIERTLHANDLMICSAEEPMCIAGVFGGLESGVTERTTAVFLESAYFEPVGVRKTARRHGLNTDASFRYERGCDPNNTLYLLKRCALLIQEVAGGVVSSGVIDVQSEEFPPFSVQLAAKKIDALIGKELGAQNIETILKALEIKIVSFENGVYRLEVPRYRVDVQRDVDVIEDILRIYGYNNIELSESLHSTLSYSTKPDSQELQHKISEQLTASGFNEILNNSLTKGGYYEGIDCLKTEESVQILNALSNDLNVMRQTLLFGGLESIARNANRQNPNLRFYEFGNCYRFNAEKRNPEKVLAAYTEKSKLGLWITGNKTAQTWMRTEEKVSFYELKGGVENVLRRLGIPMAKCRMEFFQNDLYSEGLEIFAANHRSLGTMGVVGKRVRKQFDIDNEVYYAELDWGFLMDESAKAKTVFTELAKFPEVRRDLALLVDKKVTFGELQQAAFQTEKKLLKQVHLFDVYEGKNLEAGKKSYALSFILQDESQTLVDKQIEKIMGRLFSTFQEQFGAQLR